MTPIAQFYAVRGTDFSEVIIMADDQGDPVNTTGASGSFQLRHFPNGEVIWETTSLNFSGSQVTVNVPQNVLNTLPGTTLHYDLFIQLQGDIKKKILRGDFVME